MSLTVKDAQREVDKAISLLEYVNATLKSIGAGLVSFDSPATPAKKSCEFCPVKFRCGPYWEYGFWLERHDSRYRSVRGTLAKVSALGENSFSVVVTPNWETAMVVEAQNLSVQFHGDLLDLRIGTEVILTDFVQDGRGGSDIVLTATPRSAVWFITPNPT